jgi:drug/metabolite transporter (DMT)-like permease
MAKLGCRQWVATAALGATGVLAYNLLFFQALALLPAGRASVIVALNPVVTLMLAAAVLGDRLSPRRWMGAAMALAGVWTVVTRGDLSQLAVAGGQGELAMFGAVCAWAVYTLIGRTMLRGVPPLVATAWAALWGVLFLLPMAWLERAQVHLADVTPGTLAGLAFLGVLGTAVAFVWYSEGVQRLGSDRAVVFNNLVPVFGVALGWAVLGEPVGPSALVGGVLAVTGVFVVNRAE